MSSGDGHDFFDGADVFEEREVGFFFFVSDLERVDIGAGLFFGEHANDVTGGHAAESVEAIFRKDEVMALCDGLPCAPVEGHGIGEGAVAIEDERFGLLGGFDGHGLGSVRGCIGRGKAPLSKLFNEDGGTKWEVIALEPGDFWAPVGIARVE